MEPNDSISHNKLVFHDSLVRELEKLGYELNVLDACFGSREFGYSDILALDNTGRLIIVDIYPEVTPASLIESADKYRFVCAMRNGLSQLYPDYEINSAVPPAMIIVCADFPSKYLRNVSMLNIPEVVLIRIEFFTDKGNKRLKLSKVLAREPKISDHNSSKVGVDELKKKLKELAYDVSDVEIDAFLKFYE